MSVAYVDLLEEVIDDIAADDSVRAFVLTAEGTTNFSVGMNLKAMLDALHDSEDKTLDELLAAERRRCPRHAGRP